KEHSAKRKKRGCLHCFRSYYCLLPHAYCLLNHLVRPREKLRRKCQPDLFSCLQVDRKLELRYLLHRQIGRFGTFQNLVHVNSRTPVEVNVVCPVRHKTALIDKLLLRINSREPVLDSKLHDPFSFGEKAVTGGSS